MAEDTQLERFIQTCVACQRDMALAQIDAPPGEVRATRLAEVVRHAAEVCSAAELQGLQSAIDTASAALQPSLRRLRAWGLETHLQGAVLPQQRDLRAQQRSATCWVDEEPIPLLTAFAAMATENRRERRGAIEAAVAEQLEESNDLLDAQYKTLCQTAEALGYASLEALWMDILPAEPATLQDEVGRFLEATHDVYADLLIWAVKRRLDVPPGQLRRHDILALFTFPEYQRYYQPGTLISALRTCLLDLGIDPRADGRITLRQCPPEFGPPAAAAVHIPDDVVLTYSQLWGLKHAEAYASAYGNALLWAYTSPELPLLTRILGDAAFATSSAQLLAEIVASPGWLRHYLRVTVDVNYSPWRRLDRLYRLRRQLGRFLYTQHVATADSLAGAREAYREIMMDACLVDHHPAYYLVDWDWTYSSLAFFRGWKLAYVLLHTARQEFDHDWYRNPDFGVWLRDYWQGALGEKAEALAEQLGGMPGETALWAAVLDNEEVG